MSPTEQPSPSNASPALSTVVRVMPIIALAKFRRLMHGEGWDIDLPRMCVDTAYAYSCLATAHTSSDLRLRQAAVGLFEAYDRNTARQLVH